ncbi:hypothetical protein SS50377_25369 [Spironucleus salmonicida]|uniref:Uncharacterized protein n=1 Tax=Spironucleus salmonicida TaxID=348837 RepID=V6LBD1_9EUKA|nr:hypothetical protein SS50377_25369 [Spironucleus salmonicida]|eukprot:EST41755.1 hypothetical protein SS50377_18588 [Spironucleus salmonicida]
MTDIVQNDNTDQFFENPLDIHQLMIDFGNLSIESNKKDYSLLHKLIKKCIDEIKESMINQFAEIVEKSKHQTALVFEKRPVYVLFEQELNCNPETDHLAPKNLYPIFKPKIEVMFDQILKVINGYTTTELISAEEKVAMLCRQILAEITEINDYLIVELITKSTESDKFQQLADTQKVKNLNEQQNMRKRISLLKEQIMEKRRTGVMYSPDFLKDINEASEFKNSVSGLNDRFKTVAIRNGNLEAENAKMKGQLEIFSNSNEYLDRTIKELDKIKQAYVILQNKYIMVTNNINEDDDTVQSLTYKISQQQETIRLFAARLEMYGDDPEDVAAENLQYLTIDELYTKFQPNVEKAIQITQTYIDMSKMNLLDSGDSMYLLDSYKEQLAIQQQHLKNPIHKFIQTENNNSQYFNQSSTNQSSRIKLSPSRQSPTRSNQSYAVNQMTMSGGQIKDISQAQINILLQQLSVTSIEQLENFKTAQSITNTQKALTAGANTLNVREVNFDTNNDNIVIQDHSTKYQQFIKQSSTAHLVIMDNINSDVQFNNSKEVIVGYKNQDTIQNKKSLNKIDQYDNRQLNKLIKGEDYTQIVNSNFENRQLYQANNNNVDNVNTNETQYKYGEISQQNDMNNKIHSTINNIQDISSNIMMNQNSVDNIINKNQQNNQEYYTNNPSDVLNYIKKDRYTLSPGGHCVDSNKKRIALSEIEQSEQIAEQFSINKQINKCYQSQKRIINFRGWNLKIYINVNL